jgi:hypothetical protein
MKNSRPFQALVILFFLCYSATGLDAQNRSSLKERGYQALAINAKYAFYNDLSEITDSGTFENVTAGFRKIEGAYEILIDFGWMEEIVYVELQEFMKAGPVANGLDYQRIVYADGREEIILTINIDRQLAFYNSEKTTVP